MMYPNPYYLLLLVLLLSILPSLKADPLASLASYSPTDNNITNIVPRSTNVDAPVGPTLRNVLDLHENTPSSSSSSSVDDPDSVSTGNHLQSPKAATSGPTLRSLLFLRGNLFNQAFGQSATTTLSSSRVGTADGGVTGGAANGGAVAAGASTVEGDRKGPSSDGVRDQPDNASEGRTAEVSEEDGEGEGESGGDRKEAEDDKVNTGDRVEQEGDGGGKEAEEGGEESSAEGGEEEEESTPLADTPEKLERWFKSWRENASAVLPPAFRDASTMEVLELDDWPPVPVPLPNLGVDVRVDPSLDPNAWRPFHVKGTPRIITVFSAECSTYMDWQSVAMAYSFKRSGQPGKLVRLLACNEDALKGYRGLDIAPTMVVPNWSRGPRTGDWYPAINKPVGVKYWLDNSPDANDVEWVLIMDADQLIRRPVLPWELGAERGHPVSANYGYLKGCDNSFGELHMNNATSHLSHCYLKGCDNSFGELHMNNATYCDKVSSSSFPPLSLLFPSSFPRPSLLLPSSFPPLSLLLPSSFPPPSLLFPSSFPPPSLIFPASFPPLSLLLPSSFPPLPSLSLLFPHPTTRTHILVLLLFSLCPTTQPHTHAQGWGVGGYIVIHVEDLRRLAPIWSAKSEEVRADVEHYTINATGDVHGQRWISEMYGYSFGSSDVSPGISFSITTYISVCGLNYTVNAMGDMHGQRWISESLTSLWASCVGLKLIMIESAMLYLGQPAYPCRHFIPSLSYPLSLLRLLSLSQVGLKHIMIDSAMLYPGYDPPKGVDPRMIHYGLELKVLDWQWDKSAYYRQDMVNTCGQHFPDPPEISALPGNQTYEERRRDFIVIECMAVLNRALREFHRLKRGCLVEWERDVGIMDLGGASPTVTGELRANVWARERGSGKESEGEGEGGRQGGSEGVSEKGVEGGSGSVSGGGKEGGTVKGGARKGIRVQGDYVVDVTEMKERAGLERGFLVVREPREGERFRKLRVRGGAGKEGNIPSDEDSVAYADSATNEDEELPEQAIPRHTRITLPISPSRFARTHRYRT
ncbi:unnamed protein product [Closterium sp. NIES-65]|nr:unnamed protein product [Closterium sp. NIES-65]